MRVRNDFSYDVDKSQRKKDTGFSKVSFGASVQSVQPASPVQNTSETNKKGSFFKNFTNVLGVVLWSAAVAIPIGLAIAKPHPEKTLKKIAKLEKKASALKEGAEEIFSKIGKTPDKTGWGFKLGLWGDKITKTGEELINNLVYGFGTVIVMPLVILYSPLGKKKASKEDKWFTVARQPLSFATMFLMQLTADKIFKGIVPGLVKKNVLEDKALLNADGTFKAVLSEANYSKIKFNSEVLKKHFSKELKNVKGITDDTLKNLFKLKDHKPVREELQRLLKGVDKDTVLKMISKLDNHFYAKNREKMLTQGLTIATNIFFSAPVGCTMLNVLYGKMMKLKKTPPPTQNNVEKGGQK